MSKSPEAFRTISEVAEWLDRPAHVLRFWESKFTQVKPIKRAGGRRYYRPQDMLLLGGIKKLLHDDGMTIKGVQKVLREDGLDYVSSLSQSLDEPAEAGELVPSPEKLAALKDRTDTADGATLLKFPGADPVAEDELTDASYDDAAAEYAAEPDIELPEPPTDDLPPATPEKPPATPPDEPFEAPSFFSVFDQTDSAATPDPDPAPETADQDAAEPDATAEAEPAAAPTPDAEIAAPAPKPIVVDVPVEAQSQAGPGALSRLIAGRATILAADPAQAAALRDSLRTLRQRLGGA